MAGILDELEEGLKDDLDLESEEVPADYVDPLYAELFPEQAPPAEVGLVPPPLTDVPVSDGPLAPVVDPGAGVPSLVPQKQGSVTTSTTSQSQSAESAALANEVQENRQLLQESGNAMVEGAKAEANAQADFDMAEAKAIQSVEEARMIARQEGLQRLQNDLQQIDVKVAELANFKPEKFWDSKDTADKITAALSVGLGGFGAALTGSGQNIGQVLLERQMKEFATGEQRKYESKVKQIDAMQTSAKNKALLMDETDKLYDARKLASLAQVKGQYTRALQVAKTPGVVAKIQQDILKIDNQILTTQQQIAQSREQKITTSETKDTIKLIQQNGGMTKSGKPLNAEQSKALAFYGQMKKSLDNIGKFDEQALVARGAAGQYFRDAEYTANMDKIPVLGPGLAAYRASTGQTADDELSKRDPESYNYVQQAQGFVNAILRRESGASISDPEFQRTFKQYFPQPNDGPQEIAEKNERRKQILKDTYTATGM